MFTGSGMPMRFAKLDGTIIDCFQASTEMPDESGETFPQFCDQLLDRAIGPEGYYGVFTTNMHFDTANHAGSNAIVASAQARGVPVVSSKQMLDWLDGRNGSSFQNMTWNGNVLSFDVEVASGARNLRGMLPTQAMVGQLTGITENTVPIAYTTETIKGIEYAIFPANTATYAASYDIDTTPPVISALSATPNNDGTATITWTTNEASDSQVDYGTDAGTLSLQASNASLVTSHSVTLSGLSASTTYYLRATSTDAASNGVTEPNPPAAPLQFTTPAPVCFLDETTANFAAGTPDANTYVATLGDGDVILKPATAAEFSVLPPTGEWNSYPWAGGGASTVSAGELQVDGARFNTEPEGTTYGTGTSIEFVATFGSDRLQHVGFGGGTDLGGAQMFNQAPFALFSTGNGGTLLTRTAIGSIVDYTIPGNWLNAPHRYRIDWTPSGFDYFVDGALVHTEPIVIATAMRPGISDYDVGGQALSVDWIHVTPYPASGSFTSRVYDAGGPANWDQMTWTADTPAGTSLDMFLRTGDTLIPDGSWSAFVLVPSSGSTVGGNTRYIQYRADLASTDPALTPIVQDVHVGCTAGPDLTPPIITNVVAAPGGSGSTALITWTTDEAADSRVDYGTSAGSLTLSESDPTLTASHSVNLTGLDFGTTYYFRVTSEDPSTNSATEPDPPASPLSFVTASAPCPADVTAADFQLGILDANTAIVLEDDGEVILVPTLGTDFTGSSLPAGWASAEWNTGGTATVAGGTLTVNGAHAYTTSSFGPLRSLEFVATYTAGQFQNVGFSADAAFNSPWVVVGEGSNTTGVFARNNLGAELSLGAGLLGTSHRYRIDWNASSFDFYVDGVLVTTLTQTVATNMVVQVSEVSTDAAQVSVDWLRISPYAASGSFTSRVFDQGGPTNWGAATWTGDTPAGTSLSLLVRTGNTAIPDGSWTAFNAVSNGGNVGGNSRYIQYRADLATSLSGWSPTLRDVAVACTPGADLTPPAISNVVATPALDGLSATITWDTDEPADSRVDYGLTGGALASNVTSAALVKSHLLALPALTAGTTYDFRVTSTDAALNSATEPDPPAVPLSFTTPAQACFTDALEADFQAGTPSGTYVSVTTDGEVILTPDNGGEFSGGTLPGDWTSVPWTGGTSTVSGGTVTVDGARLTPVSLAATGSGAVIEFVATFGSEAFQNIGFGAGDNTTGAGGMFATGNDAWAMFGTATTGTQVYARLNNPGVETIDLALGAAYIGTSHRYRIEWKAAPDSMIFLIDGASLVRRPVSITQPMRAGISDYNIGGSAVMVNWIRRSPYAASGTFTSRVYDAGSPATWDAMTWTGSTPAGTGLSLLARRGDTAIPDGTWTAFAPVAFSGAVVGGSSRYIQYRADLSTSDSKLTPVLEDLTIACVICDPTPPPAVADLAVSRVTSGGSGGGRIPVRVMFTPPGTAETIEVYRAPFGGYPRYDESGGTLPPTPSYPPSGPWVLTPVTASGENDDPPTRDAWSYAVFTKSACGVVSAVSNVTAGIPNYLLGDVTDGLTECVGDDVVGTADVSLLGSHYGETLVGSESWTCVDVGPTQGGSVNGRPLTDGVLQFEDLVMFGLNYGAPGVPAGPARAMRVAAEADAFELDAPAQVLAGETFDVTLRMSGAGDVQALSAALAWNAAVVEPGAVRAGDLIESQGGVVFSPGPGQMDATLLGARARGLAGTGAIAVWTFRARANGDPGIVLSRTDARDASNRPVDIGGSSVQPTAPATTAFDRVSPNPFSARTAMAFSLAVDSPVTLAIYSVDGRRIRTLARGPYPAGVHQLVWDGIDAHGSRVRPGLYFARLQTGRQTFTRTVVLVR
jgi:Purple acid Phosphatase, N-terminal domain/FlgD Ig-like domain/Glycosyl hydrolases family 16